MYTRKVYKQKGCTCNKHRMLYIIIVPTFPSAELDEVEQQTSYRVCESRGQGVAVHGHTHHQSAQQTHHRVQEESARQVSSLQWLCHT